MSFTLPSDTSAVDDVYENIMRAKVARIKDVLGVLLGKGEVEVKTVPEGKIILEMNGHASDVLARAIETIYRK